MARNPLRVVVGDDTVLFDVQRRRLEWSRFLETFGAYVARISHKLSRARGLSDADRDDLLQEVFLFVISPDRPRYDPSRSAARTYLFFAVRTAVHAVMGTKRRREAPLCYEGEGEDAGDSLVNAEPSTELAQTAYETHDLTEFVLMGFAQAERYVLLELAEDRSIAEVGAELGISRSALSRRCKGLRERAQARAVEALAV